MIVNTSQGLKPLRLMLSALVAGLAASSPALAAEMMYATGYNRTLADAKRIAIAPTVCTAAADCGSAAGTLATGLRQHFGDAVAVQSLVSRAMMDVGVETLDSPAIRDQVMQETGADALAIVDVLAVHHKGASRAFGPMVQSWSARVELTIYVVGREGPIVKGAASYNGASEKGSINGAVKQLVEKAFYGVNR